MPVKKYRRHDLPFEGKPQGYEELSHPLNQSKNEKTEPTDSSDAAMSSADKMEPSKPGDVISPLVKSEMAHDTSK